jgi:hypothetical protein
MKENILKSATSILLVLAVISGFYYGFQYHKHNEIAQSFITEKQDEANAAQKAANTDYENSLQQRCVQNTSQLTGVDLYDCQRLTLEQGDNVIDISPDGAELNIKKEFQDGQDFQLPDNCSNSISSLTGNELAQCLYDPNIGS